MPRGPAAIVEGVGVVLSLLSDPGPAADFFLTWTSAGKSEDPRPYYPRDKCAEIRFVEKYGLEETNSVRPL